MEETAIQLSGWIWTAIDHLVAFLVVVATIHIISKIQKNAKYEIKQAIIVAIGVILYSLLLEVFMPIKYVLISLPLTLLVSILLCKFICVLNWNKGIVMGLMLFFVSLIASIVEGLFLGIVKTAIS